MSGIGRELPYATLNFTSFGWRLSGEKQTFIKQAFQQRVGLHPARSGHWFRVGEAVGKMRELSNFAG
jgi:hypothetical protein